MKKLDTKREAGRTTGRIGEARMVVETIEVDLEEVGVVFMARIGGEEEVAAVSEVAEGASVVAEEASDIVMVGIISEGEGEEVSGVEVAMEEIGEDLGRVLEVKVAGEVSEVVKVLEDTRRETHLVAVKTRKLSLTIEFEGKLTHCHNSMMFQLFVVTNVSSCSLIFLASAPYGGSEEPISELEVPVRHH